MKLLIEINLDNAAFEDDAGQEVHRVLITHSPAIQAMVKEGRRVAGRMALGNYGVPSYGRDEALRPLPLTAEFMTLPRHVMQ